MVILFFLKRNNSKNFFPNQTDFAAETVTQYLECLKIQADLLLIQNHTSNADLSLIQNHIPAFHQ